MESGYIPLYIHLMQKIPYLSTLPWLLESILISFSPFLIGTLLSIFTNELQEFIYHWVISNISLLILSSLLWMRFIHSKMRKTLLTLAKSLSSYKQIQKLDNAIKLMFTSSNQLLIGVFFGIVVVIQIKNVGGFKLSPLLNGYIFIGIFLSSLFVSLGIWFLITSLFIVYLYTSFEDLHQDSIYSPQLPSFTALAEVIEQFTWAIVWMELLYIIPIFFGPYSNTGFQYETMRSRWLLFMVILIGSYFLVPQIFFTISNEKRKDMFIEKIQNQVDIAYDQLQGHPRDRITLLLECQTLYEKILKSKSILLGYGSLTRLFSALSIGPLFLGGISFLLDLLPLVIGW